MIGSLAFIAAVLANVASATQNSTDDSSFLWGAASASYQVEGQVNADNRGKSIWDVWLDDYSIAGPGISGATSINFYDPEQYKEDIGFLKRLGLTSYRFSISWPRIIPDGLGPVNMAGVNHYREFITHLKAAGIQPMLTMYHWDMPASLSEAGSWYTRDSVDWFRRYAEVVFENFHDLVDLYVLINEPTTDVGFTLEANKLIAGKNSTMSSVPLGAHDLEYSLRSYNHILLAAAAAKEIFDTKNYTGSLGMAIPLSPVLTSKNATSQDKQNAKYVDGVYNRFFLDPIVNGTYPQDILDLCKKLNIDPKIRNNDAATVGDAHMDYMGVNFYAPLYVRTAKGGNSSSPYRPETYQPDDKLIMANGPVEPDQFKDILLRIKNDYKNIPVYITENGASFKGDDVLKDGKVLDKKRCNYIVDHIEAMNEAREEGADIRGYHAWSSHDNLEWMSGYSVRFGICYVDYDNQERTPKLSSKVYSSIIAGRNVTSSSCNATTY